MSVKAKILLYIFGLIILAGLFGVFGFWYQSKSKPKTFLSLPAEVFDDRDLHAAYSMDQGFYDVFFADPQPKEEVADTVFSAVVPHHLIAGQFIGSFFNSLKDQSPDTVVIIGPNHKQTGNDPILSSPISWKTPYGILETNESLVEKIVNAGLGGIETGVVGGEHSVSTLVPFIKKTWPDAKVAPIILKNNADENRIDKLVKLLADSKNILVLTSVDFSHYLPKSVADFHDKLSLNVLESANLQSLPELEIDSQPSIYALLKYNELKQAQAFHLISHTNSGEIVDKDLAETTSHIIGYYTEGAPGKKPIASLQFFGDMMLDRNVAKVMGNDGLNYLFANLTGQEDRFFQGMHILMANLEGPFAPARVPTSKSIAFRFDPKLAAQLKEYGFDGFNLANNHSYDMSRKNVDFTRKTLAENSLFYFGDEYKQGSEYTYVAGEKEGLSFTIAFVGFNDTEHSLDESKVKAVIQDAKVRAKFVVVNIHWGQEYQQHSNAHQQSLARQMIDWGADAIIGHHPHVVQEMEVYKDKPIFYSLGNFIFDQYFSKETQEGISVGLTIGEDEKINWTVMPFFSKKSQVQLMLGEQREVFMDWFEKNSRIE